MSNLAVPNSLGTRDHIFISYATEQIAFCDWLVHRLASLGYAVWCDRWKILGGEDWPHDIDVAIERRTFRMIAILSRASMSKQNPVAEWTKGRQIGNALNLGDFVIPLKVEDFPDDELIWTLQTTTYIPFFSSWAHGLRALLKKLESIGTPRTLADGRSLAIQSFTEQSFVSDRAEKLVSNRFEIVKLPASIYEYTFVATEASTDFRSESSNWPNQIIEPNRVLALHEPPKSLMQRFEMRRQFAHNWIPTSEICGINATHIMVNLLRQCLSQILDRSGFRLSANGKHWYLPDGVVEKNLVRFKLPSGKASWFRSVGTRKFRSRGNDQFFKHYLSPDFYLTIDPNGSGELTLNNRVYLTDLNGRPLPRRQIQSRRKRVCKGWFNKQWCARVLGIGQLLADDDGLIRYGPRGCQQLVVRGFPRIFDSPVSIHDAAVDAQFDAPTDDSWR